MNSTSALVYVQALELGNFLPALMAHTVVTSGGVDAGRWIGASVEGKYLLFILKM